MAARSSLSRRLPNALIVYANSFQFGAGQKLQFPCVQSRMVLWCKAGTGRVTVNGQTYAMEAGRYLLLPWRHAIRYEADAEDPFLMAGVHLIPDHARNQPVTFTVAHSRTSPLAGAAFRRDASIPELPQLKVGSLEAHAPLMYLLEYVLHLFLRGNPEPWMARQLARQLLCELVFAEQHGEVHAPGVPPELERMCRFIHSNLHRQLSSRDLVAFGQLSPSTVERLFRSHLQSTPVAWILRTKIEKARILLRTRRLSVAQVAEQVGIADPYYFSKCFKKVTGHSPRAHRQQTNWI